MRPFRRLLLLPLAGAFLAGGLWLASKRSPEGGASASFTELSSGPVSGFPLQATFSVAPEEAGEAAPHFPSILENARRESDPSLRTELILDALTRWAAADTGAAGAWLLDHFDELPADPALAALFHGAATHPETAVEFAGELSDRLPERRSDIGSCLIAALGRAGEHARAARYAVQAGSDTDPLWLVAAFNHWGRRDPEDAIVSAMALQDPRRRALGFQAAVSGWARVDPAALARAATAFPPGAERDFALLTALRQWAPLAPDAAADFMLKNGPLPRAALVLED